jgi:hypothetical protein
MLTITSSNEINTPASPDGYTVGAVATDKIAFYGATPIAQRGNASQAVAVAVTDGSAGTAAATNGIAALTGTYNSTLIVNSIATLAEQGNALVVLTTELRAALVALGLIKGSA